MSQQEEDPTAELMERFNRGEINKSQLLRELAGSLPLETARPPQINTKTPSLSSLAQWQFPTSPQREDQPFVPEDLVGNAEELLAKRLGEQIRVVQNSQREFDAFDGIGN
jgi:hypothetical protein